MTKARNRFALAAIILLPNAGCFNLDLAQDPPAKRQFLLSAAPTDATGKPLPVATEATSGDGPSLQVNRAYVVAPFHEKPLVYRLGEHEYTSDYYNEFLVSPSQMVTQLTVDWLRRSGDWPLVHSGQLSIASHLLDLNLLQLHGDYRQKDKQTAVVRLRATLTAVDAEDGSQRVVFEKDYEAEKAIADRKADTLITGLNGALGECLKQLGQDLRKARG